MASMTIRNIDDGVMQALTAQAERKGVPVEEEARRLVIEGVDKGAVDNHPELLMRQGESVWDALERFKKANGGGLDFEIELPDRAAWKMRPVDFGE